MNERQSAEYKFGYSFGLDIIKGWLESQSQLARNKIALANPDDETVSVYAENGIAEAFDDVWTLVDNLEKGTK